MWATVLFFLRKNWTHVATEPGKRDELLSRPFAARYSNQRWISVRTSGSDQLQL